jgi:hypothetical protein
MKGFLILIIVLIPKPFFVDIIFSYFIFSDWLNYSKILYVVRNYIILNLFIRNAYQQNVIEFASWLKEHNVK